MLRKNIRFTTFIIALVVIASMFAVIAHAENNKYELFKGSVYNRALNELIDYTNDINSNLSKVAYMTSPSELNSTTSIINGAVNSAKSCLGQLPLNDINLDKLQKYLMQTASYITALANKKLNGEEVTDEEYQTVNQLEAYSYELVQQFTLLQDMVRNDGNIIKTMTATSFGNIPEIDVIDNIFTQYPTLIYDGPFSDSEEIHNYHILVNSTAIDSATAEYTARRLLGKSIKLKSYLNDDSDPQVYTYSCGNAYIDITKSGGYILRMAIDQSITELNLSVNDALSACRAFIENQGYKNMTETYYISESGILTANYAYMSENTQHGDIIYYSDLIKVGVTLDTGKVCYYDADAYLKNHISRDIVSDIISTDEATTYLSSKLEANGSRLALIPMEYGVEKLCYEFSCVNSDGEEYLIYINAVNGNQENILMLLNTGHGTLVI